NALIPQRLPIADVDLTQLNEAITAYNAVVDRSSSMAVRALAQNPEFLVIGETLRTLRNAMK
ncbi:MAG: hypothetical protein VKJ46_04265, partial [Leptolyngbyaceae bacterium]|nr:hypothetical protein [Leptolyngbyaceae bacterium]